MAWFIQIMENDWETEAADIIIVYDWGMLWVFFLYEGKLSQAEIDVCDVMTHIIPYNDSQNRLIIGLLQSISKVRLMGSSMVYYI